MTRPTKISNYQAKKDNIPEYIRDLDNDLKQLYAKFSTFLTLNSLTVGTTNTNASIGAAGDILFVGEGSGLAFGEIYVSDNTTATDFLGLGVANKIQFVHFNVNGLSNNMIPDNAQDHITLTKAGKYFVSVSITVTSPGGNTDDMGASLWKANGTVEFSNVHAHRKLSGGSGDLGSFSLSGIIDGAVGDTLEIWLWNEDDADSITLSDVTLSVIQVGGT